MNTSIANAEKINLTHSERDFISEILKREPSKLELEIFSKLWSEHASYKNSIKWLNKLPKLGENVIVKAGEEAAGAIDIGEGYVCVFKIESHNHPCSIQPRLGALTGLRVVTRDVFSMGVKPIAIMNSLRFGDGERDTAKWLFNEVAKGIKGYVQNMKIPVIGGEIFFDEGFNTNPIVNNMTLGVAKKEDLIYGVEAEKDSLIVLIGALTGKEGVDSDAFSADLISNSSSDSFPFEQMLNSEIEKSLFEAIEALNDNKLISGVQTLRSGGIVGAATEMATRGKSGMEINCEKIPVRESEITDREKLLSETWGRMLICVKSENLQKVAEVLQPKQLAFATIGKVTDGETLKCICNEELIAEIPVNYVGLGAKAPVYERDIQEPSQNQIKPLKIADVPEPDHYPMVVDKMLGSLNILSKGLISNAFETEEKSEILSKQYPSDASFVHIKEANKTLAVTIDCNAYYVEADPYIGSQIAVAEASRNIVCGGGTPMAVTDCLNFGNPYDPEVFWQFTQSVEGLSEACKKFNTPVVSGNVSFYNQRSVEGRFQSISPCPVIGMVGVVESKEHHTGMVYKHKGDMIFLIGTSRDDINASEYLNHFHNKRSHAAPYFDIEEELEVQSITSQLIKKDLVRSVHDISSGGLFFNLFESAAVLDFGFDITSDAEIRKDAFLFGESQSRVVVSVSPEKEDDFVDFMLETEFSFSALGHVTKGEIRIDDESYGFIKDIKLEFDKRLKQWSNGE